MAKENKIINIIKSRIQAAQNGTLYFNNSFPEFDDEYVIVLFSAFAGNAFTPEFIVCPG